MGHAESAARDIVDSLLAAQEDTRKEAETRGQKCCGNKREMRGRWGGMKERQDKMRGRWRSSMNSYVSWGKCFCYSWISWVLLSPWHILHQIHTHCYNIPTLTLYHQCHLCHPNHSPFHNICCQPIPNSNPLAPHSTSHVLTPDADNAEGDCRWGCVTKHFTSLLASLYHSITLYCHCWSLTHYIWLLTMFAVCCLLIRVARQLINGAEIN